MKPNPIIENFIAKEKQKKMKLSQPSSPVTSPVTSPPPSPVTSPPPSPVTSPPPSPVTSPPPSHPYTQKVIKLGQRDAQLRKEMIEKGKIRVPPTIGLGDKVIRGARLKKMKRKTFTIPYELNEMIKETVRKSGLSEGEILRCALWQFLK